LQSASGSIPLLSSELTRCLFFDTYVCFYIKASGIDLATAVFQSDRGDFQAMTSVLQRSRAYTNLSHGTAPDRWVTMGPGSP
jgi:hypothetical protein